MANTWAPLVLGVLLVSASAHAQATTPDPRAVAAFEAARKYIDAGNCDAGISKLHESLRYNPGSVGVRLSLADCLDKTDPLAAWGQLKEAARFAYLLHDDRLGIAEARAAALAKTLPAVRVVVPSSALAQPGFELRLDGVLIDKFYYQDEVIATSPGPHQLEATAPKWRWARGVVAEIGGAPAVAVKLEPEETAAPAPADASVDDAGSTRRVLGVVLGSVGLTSLAVGVVFGIVTLGKKNEMNIACGGSIGACTAPAGSLNDQRDSAKTTGTAASVGFVAGGVLMAAGAALYFSVPRKRSSATEPLRLAPAVGKREAGLSVVGSW